MANSLWTFVIPVFSATADTKSAFLNFSAASSSVADFFFVATFFSANSVVRDDADEDVPFSGGPIADLNAVTWNDDTAKTATQMIIIVRYTILEG